MADASCDNKMVELQRTFSFDEHILPPLLKERERYSGKLTEERYGMAVLRLLRVHSS